MVTPRRKIPPLKAYCLEAEQRAIAASAAAAGMSISRYLRSTALGYQIRSLEDQRMAGTLIKINADLGRLGGLLKALLTNDELFDGLAGQELQRLTIGVVREIHEQQAILRRVVEGITGK